MHATNAAPPQHNIQRYIETIPIIYKAYTEYLSDQE